MNRSIFQFLSDCKKEEKGSMAFFVAAIVLPLLFFLFSLSLDMSTYYTENQKLQKVLDDAALHAYRFLPYMEDAEVAAHSYLAQYGDLADNTDIVVTEDSVSLLSQKLSHLTFARLLGVDIGIPMTAYSRSRSTPFDALLLIDRASYLSPDPVAGTAWGDFSSWPAASFFQQANPISGADPTLNPVLLSQQCFNPAFSAIKTSAMQLYEYLISFQLNSVGVVVYPGNGNFVSTAREVLPGRDIAGGGEASFISYFANYSGNEFCAAAAERENLYTQYQFPAANSKLEEEGAFFPPAPVHMITPGSWQYNPQYQNHLRTREVIWSQATHEGSQAVNSARVFEEVHARLAGSVSVLERGGLVHRPVKTAVIFAGDVPRIGGLRFPDVDPVTGTDIQAELSTVINALKNSVTQYGLNLQVYYLLFEHEGNASSNFAGRVEQLRTFFANAEMIDGQQTDAFRLKLFSGSNPDSVTADAISSLVLEKETTVIAR